MKILAIDLSKFNCVSCLFDIESNSSEYETFKTYRWEFESVLSRIQPQLVVMETCSITEWVHDLCVAMGYTVLVADPSAEAWRWKNVKRKIDKDDALKLAKLAALEQINPVYMPAAETRQYRHLVKYRKVVVGRNNRVQNSIRALFDQQGLRCCRGTVLGQCRGLKSSTNIDDRWQSVM
ncbi:IS110 family transposase [Leptothermofonsia sp. ETS-13]|uniref:IS110 family transposase n=1 Tax=Leptothermofonsia sp. ETS-13 TaxID=3035696 RepID=UPI003BA28095